MADGKKPLVIYHANCVDGHTAAFSHFCCRAWGRKAMTKTTSTVLPDNPSPHTPNRKKRYGTSQPNSTVMEAVTVDPLAGDVRGILHGVFIDGTAQANMPHDDFKQEALAAEFLDELYMLAQVGMVPQAMDMVLSRVNKMLREGKMLAVNNMLARLDLSRLPSSLRRAFLMITHPVKNKLPVREAVFKSALRLLSKEKGETKAAAMLRTLA